MGVDRRMKNPDSRWLPRFGPERLESANFTRVKKAKEVRVGVRLEQELAHSVNGVDWVTVSYWGWE